MDKKLACLAILIVPLIQGCASTIYLSNGGHKIKSVQTDKPYVRLRHEKHYSAEARTPGPSDLIAEFTPLGLIGPKIGFPGLIFDEIVGEIELDVFDKETGKSRIVTETVHISADSKVARKLFTVDLATDKTREDHIAEPRFVKFVISCEKDRCAIAAPSEVNSTGRIDVAYHSALWDSRDHAIIWKGTELPPIPENMVTGLGKEPFGNVALLVPALLIDDLKAWAGAPPAPPTRMTQGKYERREDFDKRILVEKQKFSEQSASYRKHIDEFPAWRKTAAVAQAVNAVFGRPRITGTTYDPENQTFFVDIKAEGRWAAGFHQAFALEKHVPNSDAEEFDRKLQASRAIVKFKFQQDKLSLLKAEFDIDDVKYEATPLPGEIGAKKNTPITVQLADFKAPGQPTLREISITYSEDPELKVKYQELDQLRKRRAKDAEVRALEAEIAALRADTHASFHSDVDTPPKLVATPAPQDFALIVGVEAYQDKELPQADFAERDARAVREHLVALGVPERNIKMLIGPDATKAKLLGTLHEWLGRNTNGKSKAYFYFSGHGAPDPQTGSAYLVPWDGDATLLKETGVPLSQLYSDLSSLKASHSVAMLDACFSGAGGRSVIARGTRPLVSVLKMDNVPDNVTVLAAASANQVGGTLKAQGHGLFTYYLLKAFHENKRKTADIFAYLKPHVEDEANRENRSQSPVLIGTNVGIP
jgi:hypothetical protein